MNFDAWLHKRVRYTHSQHLLIGLCSAAACTQEEHVPAMCWHQNDAADDSTTVHPGFLSMLLVCLYMHINTFCLHYFILVADFDPTCLTLFDNETLTVIG